MGGVTEISVVAAVNERRYGGRQLVARPQQVRADSAALLTTAAYHRLLTPYLRLGFLHQTTTSAQTNLLAGRVADALTAASHIRSSAFVSNKADGGGKSVLSLVSNFAVIVSPAP